MKRLLPIFSLLLAAAAVLFALDTLLKAPRRREVLEAKHADFLHLQTLLASRQPQRDFLASAPAPDLLELAAAHFPRDAIVLSALPPLEGPGGLALRRQTLTLRRIPYADLPAFLDEAARQSCRLQSLDLAPTSAPGLGDATLTFLSP